MQAVIEYIHNLIIIIQDNGVGKTKEKLDELNDYLLRGKSAMKYENHVGISNSVQRI